MAKKHLPRPQAQTPAVVPGSASAAARLWERPWFPVAIMALLAVVYFSGFVFSNNVIFGYDAGNDYHLGESMSFGEKLDGMAQPLWNPQQGGYPQSEEIRFQYFPAYPIYLFTSFFRYLGWRYLLTMAAAGYGMFLFLSELRVHRGAALWAGVAYMSAPTFLSFTYAAHYAKMGVIALFPFMLVCLERLLTRRQLGYAAGLALGIGAAAYAPHPQMLYYALLGLGLWFLFRWVPGVRLDRTRALRQLPVFVLAVALGVGLGAEGLFPSYFHARTESKRAGGEGGRSVAEQLAFAQSWSLHPEEIGSLLVPEFGGFDVHGEETRYWGRNAMKTNSEYFGALVVLLAVVSLVDPRRSRLVWFMAGWFVLSLAFTLGGHTPVHMLIFYLLPGAKVLRTVGMAAYLFALAACVMAGFGLTRLLEASADERPLLARRVLVAGGVMSGLCLLMALAPKGFTDAWTAVFYSDIAPAKRDVLAAGYGWLSRGALIVAMVTAAGTGLLYGLLRGQLHAGVAIGGLCLLTLVDTWRIDKVFLRYEDPDTHVVRSQENARTLQFLGRDKDLFRIFPLPDWGILDRPGWHLEGMVPVTGRHDFTMRRYDRLLKEFDAAIVPLCAKYLQGEEIPYTNEQLLSAVKPLLNLTNARYLVAPGPVQVHSPDFPEAFVGERYRVYANPSALPWFRLVPGWQVASSEETALSLVRDGEVDPRVTAVLEREPVPAFPSEPGADRGNDSVERLTYEPKAGRIEVRTVSAGPRLLVLSENFHPYWNIAVDGKVVEPLRCDYVWQAVSLPAGEHHVVWTYSSPVVSRSRWLSLASLVTVAGILGWAGYRRRGLAPGNAPVGSQNQDPV